jgi:hypothetical protein
MIIMSNHVFDFERPPNSILRIQFRCLFKRRQAQLPATGKQRVHKLLKYSGKTPI